MRRTRRTLLPDVAVAVPVAVAAAPQWAGMNPSPEPRLDSRRAFSAFSSTARKVNCKHDPVRLPLYLPLTEQAGRQSVIQLVRLSVLSSVRSLCLGEGCSSLYYAVAAAAAAHAACERYLSCSIVLQRLPPLHCPACFHNFLSPKPLRAALSNGSAFKYAKAKNVYNI